MVVAAVAWLGEEPVGAVVAWLGEEPAEAVAAWLGEEPAEAVVGPPAVALVSFGEEAWLVVVARRTDFVPLAVAAEVPRWLAGWCVGLGQLVHDVAPVGRGFELPWKSQESYSDGLVPLAQGSGREQLEEA